MKPLDTWRDTPLEGATFWAVNFTFMSSFEGFRHVHLNDLAKMMQLHLQASWIWTTQVRFTSYPFALLRRLSTPIHIFPFCLPCFASALNDEAIFLLSPFLRA